MIHQGENLRRLLKERGIRQQDFANRAPRTTREYLISELNRKTIKNPELLKKVKKYLETDLNFETHGYGAPTLVDTSNEFLNTERGNIIFVPLYAYGGFLTGYSNHVFMDTLKRFFLPGVTGEHFAFEVDGMSMYDFASPGDWAISRPQEPGDHFIRGRAYVLQTVDGILIKYFEAIDGLDENAKAIFYCHNKEFSEKIKIPLKSIKKAYFVTRILKKI